MQTILRILSAASLGLLASLLVVGSPAHAMTPFPGANGRIAFTRAHHYTTDIWGMNVYGGQEQPLVRAAMSPAWSPDGRKLAFIDAHRAGRLCVASIVSGANHCFARVRDANESTPVWSRDGSRIAFVRAMADGRSAIFIVGSDDRHEVNISGWADGTTGYRAPSWSPDGKQLVYEHYSQQQSELTVRDLIHGQIKKLTTLSDVTESAYVSWSPNGKKILFADSAHETYTIWPDGSHRTVISDGESRQASWSPDGDRIVFLEDSNDDHLGVSGKDGTVTWIPVEKGVYQTLSSPSWSPDGKKILFTMSRQLGSRSVTDLFVLDQEITTGAVPQRLTRNVTDEVSWQAR